MNRQNGEDMAWIHLAIVEDRKKIFSALLALGCELNFPLSGTTGMSTVALAVWHGRKDMIAPLLDAGADPDGEFDGRAALEHAARAGMVKEMVLLVERGATRRVQRRTDGEYRFSVRRCMSRLGIEVW